MVLGDPSLGLWEDLDIKHRKRIKDDWIEKASSFRRWDRRLLQVQVVGAGVLRMRGLTLGLEKEIKACRGEQVRAGNARVSDVIEAQFTAFGPTERLI